MALFNKTKTGGFMDEIRCDEPSYLIWKWHPSGSQPGANNRENAIRWGSSLRVKDGEVAVFVYKQKDGTMQDFLQVYGKTGQPCARCGSPIEKIKLGGRGTHLCPHCQKAR